MILLIFSISFTTAFAITELQKATISDPRLENTFRISIGNNVNVDQQFQISADITNNQEKSQKKNYLVQIKKFPMLDAEEEYMLAKSWRDRGNLKSAEKLVTSHLRLVAKIAMGYRGYGLPVSEIVSEGNIGLMKAVKKFDPEKGFRLATYAMWWIKASIQEYILRSWSLVKIGTTTAQKKLFFNLPRQIEFLLTVHHFF